MKRHIILSVILFIAIVFLAVLYFRNLSTPGSRTTSVLQSIPNNAALIFGFNNEDSFYEIYNGNKLFAAVVGDEQISDLDTLRKQLLDNNVLRPFFDGQNIFISFHPGKDNTINLLLTTSVDKKFDPATLDKITQQQKQALKISAVNYGGNKGYDIYSDVLKKHFYLTSKQDGIYAGSFSKEMIDAFVAYTPQKDEKNFILLPQQQISNSLANLYVNYSQLPPLFDKLLKNKNSDIFKSQRMLPALGVLDLNFKSDALMFSALPRQIPLRHQATSVCF